MLRPEIVYLTMKEVKPNAEIIKELERLFDSTEKSHTIKRGNIS